MKIKLIILAVLLFALPSSLLAQGLTYEEQIHDFGHVGIDFKVMHTYLFINRTDVPIKIIDIVVTCDCSKVKSADTLVQPGDTAFFKLTFDTKDYYGKVNKSFSILTDHHKLPKLEYFYVSIVGQWFNGLKPTPISLFFLPSKKTQTIQISNRSFDKISVVSITDPYNFSITKVITESAKKGNSVEFEIVPNAELNSGTYLTTAQIVLETNSEKNTLLSIPIKIVKY